jgi:hypothetical protein
MVPLDIEIALVIVLGFYMLEDKTTTAKSGFNSIKSGIGMGGYGDLMGGWIRGNLYGLHLKADRYTLYVDGNHYTNGVIASLSNNSQDENRNLSFVPTSTKLNSNIRSV